MRIAWSLPVPGEPSGSSRGDVVRARRLADALGTLGHEVRLVAAGDDVSTAAAASAYRSSVRRLLPAPTARALRDVARLWAAEVHARRVIAAAAELAADVLVETQVHGIPSGAFAARSTGLPLVLDDCSPPDEEAVLQGGLPWLARWTFGRQRAAAAGMVASSRVLARRLEAGATSGRTVAVVGNGVDPHAGASRSGPRGRAVPGERLVLAFVGSFQPWHRVDLLVDVVDVLVRSRPVELLLLGEGRCRAEVLEQVERLGIERHVDAPGAVPSEELPARLADCDIGVLAGTNDYGQPMKLLEYAAAGLPVVAPDVEPVRDLVRHDATGLLFPPGDGAALACAITRLVDDEELRRRLGGEGRAGASGASWIARAQDLAHVLAGTVHAGGPEPARRSVVGAGEEAS